MVSHAGLLVKSCLLHAPLLPLLPTAATILTVPIVVNVLPDSVLLRLQLMTVLLAQLLVLSLTLFLAMPLRLLSATTV